MEVNNAHFNSVTTSNGLKLHEKQMPKENLLEISEEVETPIMDKLDEKTEETKPLVPRVYKPRAHFPGRLARNKEIEEMGEVFCI